MNINYIELKRIRPKGTLQAFASVCIAGDLNLKLSSIALHKDNNHYWITFPKIKTADESFFSYISMDDFTHDAIERSIIDKYMKEENEHGGACLRL